MAFTEKITENLKSGRSVIIVGQTDEGKSWFVDHKLLPALRNLGWRVCYYPEGNIVPGISEECDIAIFDEVESFLDQEFLENLYPEERPYYPDYYIERVKGWFGKMKNYLCPCIYIVTRNGEDEIGYFAKNIQAIDFDDRPIEVLVFRRDVSG